MVQVVILILSSPPTLSITNQNQVCAGTTQTWIAMGGANYTWMPGSVTGSLFSVPASSVSSCYSVIGTSTNNSCLTYTAACTQIIPMPTLQISSSSSTICAGKSATINLSGSGYGAPGYSLTGPAYSGTGILHVVSPPGVTCYTATTISNQGCVSSAVIQCINVYPNPTLSVVVSNSAICSGQSNTVTLSGTGVFSQTLTGNGYTGTGPVHILSPTTSACYFASATSTDGCISNTTTSCLNVLASPSVSVTLSPSNVAYCQGTSIMLTASGAANYTWLPWNANGFNMIISPQVNTCFTVIGTNTDNCSATAQQCVTLGLTPTISIAASSPSVCLGSSVTFTASGGSTYTWVMGPNTSTYNVIPNLYFYTVTASHTLNNCIGTQVIAVSVSSLCADVWPGDANSDGIVNNTDVLELGLWSGSIGAARTSTGTIWASHFATAWNGTVTSGKNRVHADCNGDGIVNNGDAAAVTNNFTLTHSFRQSRSSANPDIKIVPQSSLAYEEMWNQADILLGDSLTNISQLYGIAFDVNFDQTVVEPDSAKLYFSNSFLNATNANIEFQKVFFSLGKIIAATVRVDHSDVSGKGKIGELWYKVQPGTNAKKMEFSVSHAIRVSANAVFSAMTPDSASNVLITDNLVGLTRNENVESPFSLSPNPAKDRLILKSILPGEVAVRISDISGRIIYKESFSGTKTIPTDYFNSGVYVITFDSAGRSSSKRIIFQN
jgi:hypothetical protein